MSRFKLHAGIFISSANVLPVANIMPSARAWFDAQLAKDESIAPCQVKGHPAVCEQVCTREWDYSRLAKPYKHLHNSWCQRSHSRYVRMSGLNTDLMAGARARLRKAAREDIAA